MCGWGDRKLCFNTTALGEPKTLWDFFFILISYNRSHALFKDGDIQSLMYYYTKPESRDYLLVSSREERQKAL